MTRDTTEEVTRRKKKNQALDYFAQALEMTPTERARFLAEIGQQDPELRQQVDELLAAHRDNNSDNFMEAPPWSYQAVEPDPQALIGQLAGAYRLTKYVAKGGMGLVYLAERADQTFRRRVAVKIINANTDQSLYHRFRREVQILADLKHPNLVGLYDAGQMRDGRPYIVMEFVEGQTLRDLLNRRGPLPPATVIEIIKQAAAGLQAAHEAGVIHRDIKPANIAVTESSGKLAVKVLDFGVAARQDHYDSGVTATQGAIGTLMYMSPEQLRAEELTPASDVYSLGLTAYELLTGRPANSGKSQAEIITNHLNETPSPPSRVSANIPASIDRAVMKALAKDPKNRYPNTILFAQAMEAASHAAATLVEEAPTASSHQSLKPVTGKPKKRAIMIAGVVFVILILAIAAYRFWPVAQPPEKTPLPAPIGLRLNLGIEKPQGVDFDGCRFALFKPEVTTRPATINTKPFIPVIQVAPQTQRESSGNTIRHRYSLRRLCANETWAFFKDAISMNLIRRKHKAGWRKKTSNHKMARVCTRYATAL